MKITGHHAINAPRQAVWERLIDPETIASCLPGVENVEQTSEEEFKMSLTVGVGPVRGTYNGNVKLSNMNPPNDYQMQVDGSGRPGFVKGVGTVRLSDAEGGTTRIDYEGDVEVGGPVGAVAQRMLGGVANRMVGQFFGCIEGRIAKG